MLIWTTFITAWAALAPLINPVGSALIFLGLVGDAEPAVYQHLAKRIAVATFFFLVIVEVSGSVFLSFFGISLPIVQVAGGIVIAATAWTLLFERDSGAHARDKHEEISDVQTSVDDDLLQKIFYPFTFPITAGPGSMVVVLTLSAHNSGSGIIDKWVADGAIALAALVLSISVYVCYAYAPKLIRSVSPGTVHGFLRVMAFILLCIGVQIAWNGISILTMGRPME